MDELKQIEVLKKDLELERFMREQEGNVFRARIDSLTKELKDRDEMDMAKKCEIRALEAAVASRDEIIKAMAEALFLTSKEVG